MKKIICIMLSLIFVMSMTACGSKDTAPSSKAENSASVADNTGTQTDAANPLRNVFKAATSSRTGAYATITVSKDIKLDDESAWVGLCPAGVTYVSEAQADDVDVIWYSYEYREENDPYVFSCDFSDVEDGTYALVLTSSDDENIGYVVLQLEMTKEGEKLTFDYTDAKLNTRPQNPETVNTEVSESGKEAEDVTVEGNPAEFSMEYWEEKFPGENICPFYIDEEGTENSYFWVSGFDGWDGTMDSWVDQPFNWNGWHKTEEGYIVNEAETLKVCDEWVNGDEGMSSFCIVTTEVYEKEAE